MIWVDMYRDVISLQVTYILSALCIADKLTHCNAHLGFIGAIYASVQINCIDVYTGTMTYKYVTWDLYKMFFIFGKLS